MNKNKFFMAGNWKMNVPSSDAKVFVEEIIESINEIKNVDVLVCPPFTSIASAKEGLNGFLRVMVGAQNFYPEKSGAYTGEISAIMLREMGVTHVIVGHSERRAYFYEANDFINKKVIAAISNSLVPILCVGETIEQRRAGNAFNVVEEQLLSCLKDVHIDSCYVVSAGSANAASFVAKQKGRNKRFYCEHSKDPEYFGVKSLVESGSLFGSQAARISSAMRLMTSGRAV